MSQTCFIGAISSDLAGYEGKGNYILVDNVASVALYVSVRCLADKRHVFDLILLAVPSAAKCHHVQANSQCTLQHD